MYFYFFVPNLLFFLDLSGICDNIITGLSDYVDTLYILNRGRIEHLNHITTTKNSTKN